jgi:hypothetical protein
MAAKYSIIRKAGDSLVGVISLTQEMLDVLTHDGFVIIDPQQPQQPEHKAPPTHAERLAALKKFRAETKKLNGAKGKQKHPFQGRHLNQSLRLPREAIIEIVFGNIKTRELIRKWNISSPSVNRLRNKIKGTKAEKMAWIRQITDRPHHVNVAKALSHDRPPAGRPFDD